MGRPKKTDKEKTEQPKTKSKEIGLFDIIKYMFTDTNKLNELSDITLSRNAFMINRYMSIMYPQQANILQINKINQIEVIKFWGEFLKIYKGRTPGWVFTKGQKKATEEHESIKTSVSSALIRSYCNYYNLSNKDVENALFFFNKNMTDELNNFNKNIKPLLSNE